MECMKQQPGTSLFSLPARLMVLAAGTGMLLCGCLSTDTRNQPFTRDWQRQLDKGFVPDRRGSRENTVPEPAESGAVVVEKGPGGTRGVSVKGAGGFSADLEYKRRPAAWLRYRRNWDHGGTSARRPRR